MTGVQVVIVTIVLLSYLLLVYSLRYARSKRIAADFGYPARSLTSMKLTEACAILQELEHLEFPYSFRKGRTLALLKTGSIPSMTKLFMVTGQNNEKTASKRAIDTKILLLEAQLTDPRSERYRRSVARINYFHERYRKAGKILDKDLLHTLADGLAETIKCIDQHEWRKLTEVEWCALGVFYKALGEAMGIDFGPMSADGYNDWEDGATFARDLIRWCHEYEAEVCKPTPSNFKFVNTYIGIETWAAPKAVLPLIRQAVATDFDPVMNEALGLDPPSTAIKVLVSSIQTTRKLFIRHFCLPRPRFMAVKELQETPDPLTGRYGFSHVQAQPWYVPSTPWNRWNLSSLLLGILGRSNPSPNFHSDGYDIRTIGPAHQEGKGFAEMDATVAHLESLNWGSGCPFSRRKGKV